MHFNLTAENKMIITCIPVNLKALYFWIQVLDCRFYRYHAVFHQVFLRINHYPALLFVFNQTDFLDVALVAELTHKFLDVVVHHLVLSQVTLLRERLKTHPACIGLDSLVEVFVFLEIGALREFFLAI